MRLFVYNMPMKQYLQAIFEDWFIETTLDIKKLMGSNNLSYSDYEVDLSRKLLSKISDKIKHL